MNARREPVIISELPRLVRAAPRVAAGRGAAERWRAMNRRNCARVSLWERSPSGWVNVRRITNRTSGPFTCGRPTGTKMRGSGSSASSSSCILRCSLRRAVRRGPSPPHAARLVLTSANAVTVIDSPPFEVTESGWGEFEINVQIYIHDCNEKPIEVSHILKLYPDGDQQQLNASKPVVSERYDEIVFNDPSDALRARLETPSIPPSPNGWKSHPNAKWFTVFDMDAEFAQLQQVRRPARSHTTCARWPTSKLAHGRSTKW